MTLKTGLYDPAYEHDACGFGFVARVDGRRTRETVEEGLEILRNLEHRGARGSDPETGDGAGILLQLPDAFFRREAERLGIELPPPGHYAVGTLFESEEGLGAERMLEDIAAGEGQRVLGFRDVPVDPERCGRLARRVMPRIRQFFVGRDAPDEMAFERKLYVIRRRLHKAVADTHACYVVTLSSRTIVYKGLLTGVQLPEFYPDLQDPLVQSAIALVHARFSTNTLGSWELAHPYRYVAHNGEINTLRGNVNWMRARESRLESELFGEDLKKISPVIQPGGSDSAAFDNVLELLYLAGRSLPHAVAMMVPEAWENDELMDPERRAFYRYHSALMEAWDGPAAVAFTDGRIIGATLDRNGLRPARYSITKDGRVVMASEDGALRIPAEEVVERWRLQPGKMLVVDTERHEILHDEDVKRPLFRRRPYARWLEEQEIHLDELPDVEPDPRPEPATLFERQRAFGYTVEDLRLLLAPMARGGKEPDGSMGTDTPLAVLSERPQLLFNYFKQHFAQVTNPPIDPLREELVMSLKMSLGPEQNLFDETPKHCRRVLLDHPILTGPELEKVRHLGAEPFSATTLSTLFPAAGGGEGLRRALESLCERAERAVRGGSPVLVLSDRGVSPNQAPIPSLLATAAVHHHLVRRGIRTATTLVVETAEAREVHHFALLVGYGATAVNPYLAFETIEKLARDGMLGGVGPEEAQKNYIKAIQKGLLKILSKMGISTLLSYCGAQIFEAVGLSREVIDRYFTGTASRIGGVGLEEIAREVRMRHEAAFEVGDLGPEELDVGGEYQQRHQGQYHQWNPETIVPLQRAVRTRSFETFKEFTRHFDERSARFATLRGLLEFERDPIPLEEVEPAKEIVKRFTTGAMSLGALSKEAHETLAIAMNRLGGKSNTGEGGEDPERFLDERRSAIKQVASGRFGVTTEYLVNADMLQIKMAQGSKPGEGGQLPGHKVSGYIAQVRHSTPGVGLISPPPHHDIYSIEDLAQLIHDLKNANPRALVSVKLVAEAGVGTIAAGVAKAKADHITISGHDGGTGASPLSSIKHAGLPWELGLAETQQVLVQNDLRGRVILETDGQLKTGRDVVVAALLGAEEFAFSTAPLVTVGCIMMRVCHLNTCPVGVATQDPVLRKKFAGTPEHVINYFFFLAEEVREYMASLGFRTFEEMVGRCDRLRPRAAIDHWKAKGVDLTPLLHRPEVPGGVAIRHVQQQNHNLQRSLDNELIRRCRPALEHGEPVRFSRLILNTNRTVGGMLSGEVARRHGHRGLPDGTIRIDFKGVAGQSFGAWLARGITFTLEGTTNDYAGKGLSGGRLAVFPSREAAYRPEEAIVVGNVALYGATGGEAYFRGFAGERFAVRNSGARAVVEGVGDHGCEYMTGGVVVVLGPTGRNFAAGMSGGMAFVLDEESRFEKLCNTEMVGLEAVESEEDVALLREMVEAHLSWTGSAVARRVLGEWEALLPKFVKVMPHDLRRVLEERREAAEVAG
ncbi:Ferredoxin-dependent glutamate synthase 1 [Rubrobacter xylanophilus DSM 9941]|uniref:glutamate synthase large subunit n=1 Tax=Rubrobacter xylanophilus TaxID=49319 RepID=UPI001C63DB57|nr:glutamate synthase large subunit [Rubrobacter xylanophilus]QYJ16574.1 Ferredoxin-dependent glutamate synthase 1 [Rubrobacter xylanophilus DSM 9941]